MAAYSISSLEIWSQLPSFFFFYISCSYVGTSLLWNAEWEGLIHMRSFGVSGETEVGAFLTPKEWKQLVMVMNQSIHFDGAMQATKMFLGMGTDN